MKSISRLLSVSFLLLIFSPWHDAQTLSSKPTLEQILDHYVKAIGGREAVLTVTSRVTKGTITVPAYKITGSIAIYAKAPNKQLTEINAPVLGRTRTGFDGTTAWTEENGEVKEAAGFARRDADFYLPIKIRELYPRIDLKGQDKIRDTDVYCLEAPRGGNPKRWYFAIDSGLLIRTESRNAQGKVVSSEDYDDYRSVDGIKLPFSTRELEDGLETVTTITEVKHNIPIDDSKFAKPTKKSSLNVLSSSEQEATAQVKADTIRDVTVTLSANEMEGRGMAQPGGARAAKYIAAKFAAIGLRPGGDNATYFQQMRVKVSTPLPETTLKVGDDVFKFKRDFALAQPTSTKALNDVHGDVIFVGYGVVSDELKRNDLAGLDVRGKIVMVLKGKPENVNDQLWDQVAAERVVFGRLIKAGAAGFIVTYQAPPTHFGEAAESVSNRTVRLADPLPGVTDAARWSIELLSDEYDLPPAVLVSDETADRILAAQNLHLAEVRKRASAGESVSRDLKVRASISPRVKLEQGVTSNVIGIVEGSDGTLKNQSLVYTAHYDAFGIDTEGTIFSGAADNALGVGKLMAVAEVIGHMNPKPRRSIIFIATTGEEYGDLGAAYWLAHPTWPLGKVAAEINYDGSILEVWGSSLGFLINFGFDYSDLSDVIRAVAAARGVEIVADPVPEESFFTRGDHYVFVKRGIPSLFLSGGPPADPERLIERAEKWLVRNYHMPSDTVGRDWDWKGARDAAVIGLLTGLRVANSEAMPAWKPDSPYKRSRE